MTTSRPIEALALGLAALALAAGPACAQVYKWTDSTGKTHYGDKPPDDVKKQPLKLNVQSYDGPPQIDNWAEIIRRPATRDLKPASAGLTMYSATWCGPCKRAKAYLAEKNVSYRDVDIDESEANKAEFKSFGGGGVPLFIAGDKRMRGFNASSLDKLIAK